MRFQLPDLKYKYDSLEPYIDSLTMQIHHNKHHGTYINNLNLALSKINIKYNTIYDLLKNYIDNIAIRNNGGGFYNHNLFWEILTPNSKKHNALSIDLKKSIENHFNSLEEFKKKFFDISMLRFGSGWAWLCINNNKLIIGSTANQDNPIMPNVGIEGIPILGLDLWEHAYYLKYQNRRAEYINAFWNIINWEKVSNLYKKHII